jgi:hypothetical protein
MAETEQTETETEESTEETDSEQYQPVLQVTGSGPVILQRDLGEEIDVPGEATITEQMELDVEAEITPEDLIEALGNVRNPDTELNIRNLLEHITGSEIKVPHTGTDRMGEWSLEVQGEVRDVELTIQAVEAARKGTGAIKWKKADSTNTVYHDLRDRGIFGSGLYVAGMRRQLINNGDVDVVTAEALVDHLMGGEDSE